MRFGSREIVDVCLRAKAKMKLGNRQFYKNEPVVYFETLKTSSLEGAATTVYATGGRGNNRLIAWEGDRTLTLTFEDALLTPESFAILSGADLSAATADKPAYVHTTSTIEVKTANTIVLDDIACWSGEATGTDAAQYKHTAADIYVMKLENGEFAGEPCIPATVVYGEGKTTITCVEAANVGDIVLVDYYIKKTSGVSQIEITPDKFGGNFYLEGSTVFRREADGVDMPAELVIPNGKIQSNFTLAMASSGDPSELMRLAA